MARKIGLLALAAITAGSLSACVGPPASSYELSSDVVCPVNPSEYTGQMRIGYQVIAGTTLYLRDQGLIEACFPDAEVSWVRFSTGQDVVQGFAANSIDVGIMGSPPAANALGQEIDLDASILRTNNVTDTGEALVAKDAKSIHDLKGRTIVTAANSSAHYSLLKALEFHGINDVEVSFLSPDVLLGAWQSGDVDAAFMWGPVLAEIQKDGEIIITAGEVGELGAPTYQFTLALNPFLESGHDIAEVWHALEDYSVSVWRNDPDAFVQGNSVQTGLDEETTRRQLEGSHYPTRQESEEIASEITKGLVDTAEFMDQIDIATAQPREHYEKAVL